MRNALSKKTKLDARTLEGGIEWIMARQGAPSEDELFRLRSNVDALREAIRLW